MDPITVRSPTTMGITKNFVELGSSCPFVIQAPIILSYKKNVYSKERVQNVKLGSLK